MNACSVSGGGGMIMKASPCEVLIAKFSGALCQIYLITMRLRGRHVYYCSLNSNMNCIKEGTIQLVLLKVHKREIFYGSDFEFFTIS